MFRVLKKTPNEYVTLSIEDVEYHVPAGISVAAAVLQCGLQEVRTTPVTNSPRAPYCMMGICFDCLMEIDSVPNQQACQTIVRDGMRLARQRGAAAPGDGR